MTSEIDICNMALSHIGAQSSISDFLEASVEAQQCSLLYAPARDAVLREHAWNFASRRAALADLGAPPPGWRYRYSLPADCLVARKILSENRSTQKIEFEVSNFTVLTDQAQAVLAYTARVTDASKFDPMFVVALSWRLAVDLVPPITGSKTIQQTALSIYKNEIAAARAADAAEGTADSIHKVDWIQARI